MLQADARPLLLVCSTTRPDKPCGQARAFADKVTTLGVRTEVSGQALTHGEIIHNLGLSGSYTDTVERFMRSLEPASSPAPLP